MNRNLIQQAQKLQQRLAKAQDELATIMVEATSGGGAVKVTMNAQQKVMSVKIAPEAVNPADVAMLEDLVLSALNEAAVKAQEAAAKHLNAITGGLKIPGLM